MTHRSAIAGQGGSAAPWWTGTVAAWQPKGAASYAASLASLTGSYTFTPAGTPGWTAGGGWAMDGVDDRFTVAGLPLGPATSIVARIVAPEAWTRDYPTVASVRKGSPDAYLDLLARHVSYGHVSYGNAARAQAKSVTTWYGANGPVIEPSDDIVVAVILAAGSLSIYADGLLVSSGSGPSIDTVTATLAVGDVPSGALTSRLNGAILAVGYWAYDISASIASISADMGAL